MKSSTLNENTTIDAFKTPEGFIEITSLELLDDMVGGLIDSVASLATLHHGDETLTGKVFSSEGI